MGKKCGCLNYLSCYLQHVVPTQEPHPMMLSFPSDHPFPARFPVVAGDFSLESYPLKLYDAHLSLAMVPSLLDTILPHEPPRRNPPPTVPLSILIPSPRVRADSSPPSRGVRHVPLMMPREPRRHIRTSRTPRLSRINHSDIYTTST